MTPLELKILRKQYRLTQSELGARLNPPVSRLTIYNWESGKFAIPVDIEHRLQAADLGTPAAAPKETNKQRAARETNERKEIRHWAMVYRSTRAFPAYSSHARVMRLLASQGHVIPRSAYAAIVAEFPDILTDINGEHPMTKEQALETVKG